MVVIMLLFNICQNLEASESSKECRARKISCHGKFNHPYLVFSTKMMSQATFCFFEKGQSMLSNVQRQSELVPTLPPNKDQKGTDYGKQQLICCTSDGSAYLVHNFPCPQFYALYFWFQGFASAKRRVGFTPKNSSLKFQLSFLDQPLIQRQPCCEYILVTWANISWLEKLLDRSLCVQVKPRNW